MTAALARITVATLALAGMAWLALVIGTAAALLAQQL